MRDEIERVLRLVSEGKTVGQIAAALDIDTGIVLHTLQDPRAASEELEEQEREREWEQERMRELREQMARERPKNPCTRGHCMYSMGLPCVGPRCWREMLEAKRGDAEC